MSKNRFMRTKRPNKRKRRGGVKHRARAAFKRRVRELIEELNAPPPSSSANPDEPCYSLLSEAPTIRQGPPSPEVIDLPTESGDEVGDPSTASREPSPFSELNTDDAIKVNNHHEIPDDILNLYVNEYANIQNNLIPAPLYHWREQASEVYGEIE
ncbi:uncharacterized protein LOC114880855 isoform X1 [Osmia bicornis bicornis]|uniref:uncharacterized protein LOC114880855 isoform X1 n=1 Tax=Osmia bicornis bicornis TaxID=1437191 RepID=UPI0010F5F3D5|nr:uncharacterized protein LOC114880855 isoform X1 [Osmia bicornis bicornis]XP_029053142.1 uncharacterized protein LOC114880855 isoform X1 [Osmia bicornis bicornis]XP_046142541.1 uncharacterized protein LOC114880855 isoform X1 [Osmia bicornis bicornis]